VTKPRESNCYWGFGDTFLVLLRREFSRGEGKRQREVERERHRPRQSESRLSKTTWRKGNKKRNDAAENSLLL